MLDRERNEAEMAPNCKGPASATAEPQPSLSAVILHRSSPNMSSLTTSLSDTNTR